jgi:hypothetical protein
LSKKEQNQRHYQKHKEKIAAKQKEWRDKNPKRFAYLIQKRHCKERGIEFLFEFDEWVDWWGDDFANRGCNVGQLVMARKGDEGPYHPDNVFKQTCSENVREYWQVNRLNTA